MTEDSLLSLEEAMDELQIDQDQIKELIRQNALRYTLIEGRIKIPKMALMALKIERMTSNTKQFEQVPRSRKRGQVIPSLDTPVAEKHISPEEAINILQIDKKVFDNLVISKRLRTITVDGKIQIPLLSLNALKIQLPRPAMVSKRMEKRKPTLRRKY